MSFPTEQEHFDAVKAILETVDARPFDYDEKVPHNVKAYTLLTISDRFGGVVRMTGQVGTRSVRITVRAVGSTADNVREIRRRVEAALREQVIAVGAFKSTPIAFETAENIAQDGDVSMSGNWWSALTAYTYVV